MSYINNLSFNNNINKHRSFNNSQNSDRTNFSSKNFKSIDYQNKNSNNLILNKFRKKLKKNINEIFFEKRSFFDDLNVTQCEENLKNNISSTIDASKSNISIFPYKNNNKENIFISNYYFKKNNNLKSQINIFNDSRMHQENIKNYILKTRKLMLEKYIQFYKKERINRINEDYQTKIGNLNEKINFLKESEKLFMTKFLNKFNDYVKNINKIIEKYKNLDKEFIKKINILKYQINKLNNKIKNLQNIKDSLKRWMFLQIQFHEKLKTFPKYYIEILNNDDEKVNPNLLLSTNSISINEINRIKLYKKNMIYKTGEEFLNIIKVYESKNILLINKYNNLRNSNRILLENLKSLKYENDKSNENFNCILELKNKIINNLKTRNLNLKNKIKKYNKLNNYHLKKSLSSNLIIKPKTKIYQLKKEKLLLNPHSKLYLKISEIEKNIINLIPKQKIQTYKIIQFSENLEMLKKLKTIEIGLNHLLNINRKYKIYYSKEIDKISLKIEKENKIKNNKIQKEYLKLKNYELKKTILNRSNKIYFLPKKKVERYKPIIINKKLNKTNQIIDEDYFYDIKENDINNNSYNFL